jgi:AraC family cel operon transcriptional repressor
MYKTQFLIKDFLEGDVRCHFARKFLDSKKPKYQHSHDFYELFVVIAGQVDHIMPFETTRLDKGALVFIRPFDCHALQSVAGSHAEIINVSFSSDIAEHLSARYSEQVVGHFFWHQRQAPDIYQLAETRLERIINISNELHLSNKSLLEVEHFLLTIFTRVIEHSAAVEDAAPNWLLEASAKARQPDVFRDGAAGFVRVACRSHEHVCRVAKKFLGVSPTDYVNKIRMEYAALMLAGSDLSISDVATDCGIDNISYFYRTFQKQYASTPRQYRVRHRKNPQQAH